MAASSNKPSPSGQPVATAAADASHTNNNKPAESEARTTTAAATETAATEATTTTTSSPPVITLKDPPRPAAAAAAAAAATATAPHPQQQQQVEPTYQSSQESTDYVAAKALLNQGAFEDALVQIEQGIAITRHALASCVHNNNSQTEEEEDDDDKLAFHPALAPFHYLYGTTLLYAVEESSDTMGLTNANATTTTATAASASNQGEPQAGAAPAGGDDGEEEEEDVEDIQIAWETLDLARTILERMMSSTTTTNNKESSHNEYALDLAQIYLRQGDLHKMNGRYGPAVADYQACLNYRTQVLSSSCLFDRKIADAHYNLALSHMMLVAEQQQQQQQAAAGDDTNTPPSPLLSPAALKEHRERSIHHYLECARTFCGILAILCQQDPNEFFQEVDDETDDAAATSTANFKTTGEEEQDTASSSNNKLDGDASRQLAKLRQHVQRTLQPPTADEDFDTKAEFEDICQMLTEIQETIDEAENSVKGVHQVAEMKAEISAAAAAASSVDDDNDNKKNDGQQAAASYNAFGSTAAAASTAVAQTIMAVKKKPKKRPPPAVTKAQDEATKRPKSAE